MPGTGPGLAQLDGHDARAKVELGKHVRSGHELEERDMREKRGGEWVGESQRERQPIRLGDDSPMLSIYSIRREGERGGANGLGGGQSSIIAPLTGSGGGRDGDRRDKAPEKKRGRKRDREREREG